MSCQFFLNLNFIIWKKLLQMLGFPEGSVVKNLLANAGNSRDLDKIPRLWRSLEKEMAIHSSILAWKIPGIEKPRGHHPMGSQRLTQLSTCAHTHSHTHVCICTCTHTHTHTHRVKCWHPQHYSKYLLWIFSHVVINTGDGKGTPLQYSCLENPIDGGAW